MMALSPRLAPVVGLMSPHSAPHSDSIVRAPSSPHVIGGRFSISALTPATRQHADSNVAGAAAVVGKKKVHAPTFIPDMTYGLPYGAAAGPMSRTSGSSSGRTARRSGGSTSSPLSSPGSSLSSTSPNMQTLGTGTGSSTHLFMPYLMTDNNIPATTASNNNCSPGDYHGVATTNNTSTGSSTVWPEESLHTEIARRSANAGYKSSAPNFPGKLDEAANKPLANAKSTAPSPSPRHRVTDCAAVAAATSLDASQILQQPLNGNSAAASRSAATGNKLLPPSPPPPQLLQPFPVTQKTTETLPRPCQQLQLLSKFYENNTAATTAIKNVC